MGDTIQTPNGTDTFTVENTGNFTVWIDDAGHIIDKEPYDGGTKLLRDAAQAAEEYCRNNTQSRSGWKTRRELRNV